MSLQLQRVAAVLGLVVASPVLGLGMVVVRLSSRGPVFFRAQRVGLGGEPFTMLKLRTMDVSETPGSAITSGGDSRVFPAGRWLRRLKVDELPQLVNVARGEMCFVGPRPEAPAVVDECYTPWMWETLSVPPGIVGPGSLGYFREEHELPEDPAAAGRYYADVLLPRKLARDLVYVRHPSGGYRLEIVARTLLGVVGLSSLLRKRAEIEDERAAAILREVHHP